MTVLRDFSQLDPTRFDKPKPAAHPLAFLKAGENVTITPEQAALIIEHTEYDRQRQLIPNQVKVLADLMTAGRWQPLFSHIFMAVWEGRLHLINGQHRMHAQVSSGATVAHHITIHTCTSLTELRELYMVPDTNQQSRTPTAIIDGLDYAARHGLSKRMAAALYNAMPIVYSGFPDHITGIDVLISRVVSRRLEAMEEYLDAARLYDRCLHGGRQNLFRRLLGTSCTAVALVTLHWQKEMAEQFWKGVAHNDGLRRGDPRQALVTDLLQRDKLAGGGNIAQRVGPAAMAWNAWFEDRDITYIKVPGNYHCHISGTPLEYTRPRDRGEERRR